MNQTLTGTIHGNTIILDASLEMPAGQRVEVVVRDLPRRSSATVDAIEEKPPAWWTNEDDRILDEIYQARKQTTRPEVSE
jgi:hypothetical protein